MPVARCGGTLSPPIHWHMPPEYLRASIVQVAGGFDHAPCILGGKMRAQNLSADPSGVYDQRRRLAPRSRVRPFILQAGGLLAEGVGVAASGYFVTALGLIEDALPKPAFVAIGYMTLVLMHGGVAAPPGSAKIGMAIRMLASAFVFLAIGVASSRL